MTISGKLLTDIFGFGQRTQKSHTHSKTAKRMTLGSET